MDDLISRQAAIDAINTWDKFGVDERSRIVRWHEGLEPYVHLRDVLTAIVNLPPARPERKRGRWKHVDPITEAMGSKRWMPWYCSECGTGVGKHQTTFCPNCGADMRGEQDE